MCPWFHYKKTFYATFYSNVGNDSLKTYHFMVKFRKPTTSADLKWFCPPPERSGFINLAHLSILTFLRYRVLHDWQIFSVSQVGFYLQSNLKSRILKLIWHLLNENKISQHRYHVLSKFQRTCLSQMTSDLHTTFWARFISIYQHTINVSKVLFVVDFNKWSPHITTLLYHTQN